MRLAHEAVLSQMSAAEWSELSYNDAFNFDGSIVHYPGIEEYIGNTPLVRLRRLGETSNTILAKLEGNNPAGSVKDRPEISMIRHAE